MILDAEGAFRISIDCYDATRSGHLKLEVSVVCDCIETGENSSSEQCMITTTEGDDVKDQIFGSEVIRRSEDHFQCY